MDIQKVYEHIVRNGERYRREFVFFNDALGRKEMRLINAIKQARSETGCGLKEAKEGVEMWQGNGFPFQSMELLEAKILIRNLLLRGGQSGLTHLEVEALETLIR